MPTTASQPCVLTFEWGSQPEWSAIDLGFDLASARCFWATILEFVRADRATSLSYRPELGDACLSCTVDEQEYPLDAPPAEFRTWLLNAGRDLLAGSPWRGRGWSWGARMWRRTYVGFVVVEIAGERHPWRGTFAAEGTGFRLVFQRQGE